LPEGLLESRLPQTQGISADPAVAVPVVPVKVFLEPATVRGTTLIRVSSSFRADAASLMLVRNYEELYGLLKEMSHRPGITTDTPLVIAARPSTAWDQVVNAYNAALRARYKNIVFAGWK